MTTDDVSLEKQAHPDREPDDAPTDGSSAAGRRRAEKKRSGPRFWRPGHPAFVPLCGFFTGLVSVAVIYAGMGYLLRGVLGIDLSENLIYFPIATAVLLVVDAILFVPHRTRRFARYLLAGVLITPVVIIGVALLTAYVLISLE